MQHLTLPVLDANEAPVVSKEVVEAEHLEDGCWRLLHSPAFIWGLARGDIMRLDPVEAIFDRACCTSARNVMVVRERLRTGGRAAELVG